MSEITHYGVLGMKWGVRKERERNSRKRKHLSKNVIGIGLAATAGILVAYGSYRYVKYIKDTDLSLATEKAKKYVQMLKDSDLALTKKNPELGNFVKSESDYDKIFKGQIDKEKSKTFSEARERVKKVSDKAKEAAKRHKETVSDVKKRMKRMESGKPDMFDSARLSMILKTNPEIFKELGYSVAEGKVFKNGKRVY